ncbi:MAG: leucyl aminopeptidase family protein [Candidatus Liptonbacteria bacterium]|nr:leucyl aminopeptidase family protein [Candidatus Liptonbacteria bacterium]
MKLELADAFPENATLVLLLHEGAEAEIHPFFKRLDAQDARTLAAFLKHTPLKAGHARPLFLPGAREVLLAGIAKKKEWRHRTALLAARRVIAEARKARTPRLAVNFDDFSASDFHGTREELAEALAVQWQMANFEFVQYKTPPPGGWPFVEHVAVWTSKRDSALAHAVARGAIIGEEINNARVLANTPGGDMTPQKLAEEAVKAGKKAGCGVTVLDEQEIKALGMGGVLGVSRGSTEKPCFIVMEYSGDARGERPAVLVGKGVTFDTGGLNLKADEGIYEMHMDMSGGAAVIHAIIALARLKVKKNVIGLVPAVENMPSGSSYHPGDVLYTMSGKTIEVLNTDAEGRIILADALEYAKRYRPRLVIDVATLTGASVRALGQRMSAILTTEKNLENELRACGEAMGDYLWPLPLWEEYEEEIKGTFADVANAEKTKYGGAITAACFLLQFVKNASGEPAYPWVHLDIAPRMTATDDECLAKGAAGASIALLTRFLEKF